MTPKPISRGIAKLLVLLLSSTSAFWYGCSVICRFAQAMSSGEWRKEKSELGKRILIMAPDNFSGTSTTSGVTVWTTFIRLRSSAANQSSPYPMMLITHAGDEENRQRYDDDGNIDMTMIRVINAYNIAYWQWTLTARTKVTVWITSRHCPSNGPGNTFLT